MNPKKNILLVDDDPLLSRLYETTLKAANYNVTTVSNGETALAEIDKSKPDLALLDIMMPKMNGIELLKKIKEDPKKSNMRVIILTNMARNTEEAKTAMQLGANDYMIKSETSLKELVGKVLEVIGQN
ncbi:MAG: response regulator [bacterium]|nr:response regulator [bacterium]